MDLRDDVASAPIEYRTNSIQHNVTHEPKHAATNTCVHRYRRIRQCLLFSHILFTKWLWCEMWHLHRILRYPARNSGCWMLDADADAFILRDCRSWTQNPGSRILDPGCRIPATGFRVLDPGSGDLDPESGIQDPGPRILDIGSWILDPGSWIPAAGFMHDLA